MAVEPDQLIERVQLEASAGQKTINAVAGAFDRAGLASTVDNGTNRPGVDGADDSPWTVTVMLAVPLINFLSAFGESSGQDAYETIKTVARNVRQVRPGPGNLVFDDSNGPRLILGPDAPVEALDRLRGTVWDDVQGDVVWDEKHHHWLQKTPG